MVYIHIEVMTMGIAMLIHKLKVVVCNWLNAYHKKGLKSILILQERIFF